MHDTPPETPDDATREENNQDEPMDTDKPKGTPGAHPPDGPVDREEIKEKVVEALKTVYDPEIPVDIYSLGMIYDVDVSEQGNVDVRMTLTSPNCPVAGSLPGETETKIAGVEGVLRATIDLTWEPPWNPDMMSDAAKLQLNMM